MLTQLFEGRSLQVSSEPMQDWFDGGSQTNAGISVSQNSAMKHAAVYSCIYILSSSMAQLPLHVLRRTKTADGKDLITNASDHPAYYLLHDEPNEWYTSYEWRNRSMQNTLGWGNGLTEIVRRRNGEITELKLHDAWNVSEPQKGSRSRSWYYPVYDEDDNKRRPVLPHDMVHVQAFTSRRKWGISPIIQQSETIGMGMAAQKYAAEFFGSGGRPSGILTSKGALKEEGRENLRKAWNAAGIGKGAGRTALLHGDIDYKPITVAPDAAQCIETRKLTRSEIAGIFNVPAHMINDLEKATFSNISEQAIQFVRHSIMPWIVKHEQELNRKIFTPVERKAGYYVKFNLAGLLRGTPKERAAFYHYGITDGWLSRNEVRAFEDKNPEPGLDEFLISVNANKSLDDTGGTDDDKETKD